MQLTHFIRAFAFAGVVSFANSAHAGVIRVDAAAGGANNGTTWFDAFRDLQSALASAQSGDEIWVARGTYRPAPPAGARTISFDLRTGVALYGGFAGFETARSQRDFEHNPTILSGDLNGDDAPGFANDAENSFHVVRCTLFFAGTASLDGFIIEGGNATPNLDGGGILHSGGHASYTNLVLRANRAAGGGGLSIAQGSVHILRCTFMQNVATVAGGALSINPPTIDVHESLFIGNSASLGGAFFDGYGGNGFVNCIFSGNTADFGGAVLESDSQTAYFNCTFSANHAAVHGGGIESQGKLASGIISCILWGNTGATGGTVENQHSGLGFNVAVTTCTIEGFASASLAGTNGLDPRFVNPLGPDGIAGTLDDDLRIQVGSPCIDSSVNHLPPASVDFSGRPRAVDDPNTPLPSIFNSIVDRGANEYRPCVAPENYCTSTQNSVGAGSLIGFSGTGSVLANNLVLRASGNPPGAIGVFLLGHTPIATPFGNGVRCVDGGVVRLSPLTCDANGVAVFAFDVHAPPALVDAGEIRRFQFWYRDSSGGGAGFNLSDGLLVHFCP